MKKDKSPVKTDGKQIKGRFKPGVSGNPKGKPKGSRHKSTMMALALLDTEAQQMTRVVIDMALKGDMQALTLCLSRLIPPVSHQAVLCRMLLGNDQPNHHRLA